MAFTNTEKVQIRRWLGFPALFRQESILESAMDAQDAETEAAIRSWLGSLSKIECKLVEKYDEVEADTIDELRIDPVRGSLWLKQEARRYVGHISDALRVPPKRDVLNPVVPNPEANIFR